MVKTLFRNKVIKTMIGAVALAAGIALGGSGLTPPAEAAPDSYKVEVSFEWLKFSAHDDGIENDAVELYGNMLVQSWAADSSQIANVGIKLASSGGCDAYPGGLDWPFFQENKPSSGGCRRVVQPNGNPNYFAHVPLCHGDPAVNYRCFGSYQYGRNKVIVNVKPGGKLQVGVTFKDWDKLSSDDYVCLRHDEFGPLSATDLATLNRVYIFDASWWDYANCQFKITMKRVL